MKPLMTFPTVHLNGSSRLDLLSLWAKVAQAANDATLERLPYQWRSVLVAIQEDALATQASVILRNTDIGYREALAPNADAVVIPKEDLAYLEPQAARCLFDRLVALREALCAAAPHGRDYYPQGDQAFNLAREAHWNRVKVVTNMLNQIIAVNDSLCAED